MITKHANNKRLSISEFKKKYIIIFNNRNIKISRSNKLFNYKNLGFFFIIRIINNMIYKFKLSNEINIFFVFYSLFLNINNNNLLLKQIESSSSSIQINKSDTKNFVDKILDSKINERRKDFFTGEKKCFIYKFKWTGYSNDVFK